MGVQYRCTISCSWGISLNTDIWMWYRRMPENAATIQGLENVCHHSRSDQNDLFSRVIKCILHNLAAVEYILATKPLPGWITFVAWWRVTISVSLWPFSWLAMWSKLVTLSVDSLISMRFESNIIPKRDNNVVGPSNFSAASGTSSSAHKDRKISRFLLAPCRFWWTHCQIIIHEVRDTHILHNPC